MKLPIAARTRTTCLAWGALGLPFCIAGWSVLTHERLEALSGVCLAVKRLSMERTVCVHQTSVRSHLTLVVIGKLSLMV